MTTFIQKYVFVHRKMIKYTKRETNEGNKIKTMVLNFL